MQNTTETLTQTIDTNQLDKRREFDRSRPLERDKSSFLIASDKVEGTDVFATNGEKIGMIDKLMLGKRSGRVEYAVMSFGGFLGIGEKFTPVPWESLDYSTNLNGYVVNIDKDRLKDAPSYDRRDEYTFDRAAGEQIYAYYGVMY